MPKKKIYKRKNYRSKRKIRSRSKRKIRSRSKSKRRVRGGSRRVQKGGFINPLSAISTFVDALVPSSSSSVPTPDKPPIVGAGIKLKQIRNNYRKLVN